MKLFNVNYSLFFKYNLFITTFLFLIFTLNNIQTLSFVGFILLVLAAISTSATVVLIFYILTVLLSFSKKYILYFCSFLFIFANLGLIVDFFIFKLYNFHINAMVLNIILSPKAHESLPLGIIPFIVFFVLLILFIFIEYRLISYIINKKEEEKNKQNKKLNKIIILPIVLIILFEKVAFGLLSLFSYPHLTSNFATIPLYQPLTFYSIAYKHFGFEKKKEENKIVTNAKLNYPLNEVEYKQTKITPNIFIFSSDAARNMSINNEITPNVVSFSKDAIKFNNHYSGGNSTRFGIFSLFYGLNSTYWFPFYHSQRSPVFFDVLQDLDYEIDIFSSTSTQWPEFDETVYKNIKKDNIKDEYIGDPWEKDRDNFKAFEQYLDSYNSENKKPIFNFVFFDAPHGYSFPSDQNIFKADDESVNYLNIEKDSSKNIMLKYHNAMHYNDSLFGKAINKLKEKGLYENSIIIFTSDHGEEFHEYGFFGHNSAFSKAQVNVPFIIKMPKDFEFAKEFNLLTSHTDVVPTLLSYIGVKNAPSDYANGYDMFNKNFKREFIYTANWNNNAIIDDENTFVFSNMPNKIFSNETRQNMDYEKIDKKINNKYLLQTFDHNKAFLK